MLSRCGPYQAQFPLGELDGRGRRTGTVVCHPHEHKGVRGDHQGRGQKHAGALHGRAASAARIRNFRKRASSPIEIRPMIRKNK